MKYQEAIKEEMEKLAKDEKVFFVGYNVIYGNKSYGTLKDVPSEKKIETPLAENLMSGIATGLAMEGFKPVLYFERHDFMLVAMDALVNHIDKMEKLSQKEFKCPMIIRAVVGATKPLYPGLQHIQDFTEIFKKIFQFPVYEVKTLEDIREAYSEASRFNCPVMIIERKDLYSQEFQEEKMVECEKKEEKERLILDGTKLAWHKERMEAWLRGERIAPITIDCALTRRCNYNCVYCYGKLQENEEKKMTKEVIFRFLDDAAELGVKAISFVSDGESTCSPYLYDSVVYGKSKGLDMAIATNGSLLDKTKLKEMLECLTYLRFNISAGTPKRYSEIHGCSENDFWKVVEIIKECVRIKKENNLQVTIGLQMVLLPEFKDEILPLTKLGKELRADYLVIKHCSDDEEGSLGVNYKGYFDEELIEIIKQAEALSDENYFVKAKWSKILSGGKRDYSRCYGPPFIIQLSGSGLVAPCGMFFNEKYKKYHIGNICDTSFKEMFHKGRYWEVMDLIASENFDAKTMCGTLCVQHKVNEFLDQIKKGEMKYETPKGNPPQHLNFI